MIVINETLPANVFGYAVIGNLESADYAALRPKLKQYAARLQGGINLFVDVSQATGLSTRAVWEEAKLEWELCGSIQRVALIGTPLWTRPFVKLADMLRLGTEVHTFAPTERDQAIGWLAGVLCYQ